MDYVGDVYLVRIIDGANFDREVQAFVVMGDSIAAHDAGAFEAGKHSAKVFLRAQAEGDSMARQWAEAIRYEVSRMAAYR